MTNPDVGTLSQSAQRDVLHQAEYFRGEMMAWGIVLAMMVLLLYKAWEEHRRPPSGGTPC